MKKVFLTLVLALGVSSAFAQTNEDDRTVGTTTSKGQVILPQAGDYAIGIDAISLIESIGDHNSSIFNNHTNPIFGTGTTIYGKYFLTDKSAIRVKLSLDATSYTDKNLVRDDAAYAKDNATDAKVEDSRKTSNSGFGLTIGYELRRGYGRLQGYYGVEAGFSVLSKSVSYDYGNSMSRDLSVGATTTSNFDNANSGSLMTKRTTKINEGTQFGFGAGLFAGVEYFVGPKISLGLEVGLNAGFANTGKAKTEWEYTTGGELKTDKYETAGKSSFDLKTGYKTAFNVAFYF